MLLSTHRFADVILPLAVPGRFTYALPDGLGPVVPGMRVAVPFGRGRKIYGALVQRVHDEAPGHHAPREVLSRLDDAPVVTTTQLELWQRIADHYLCTLGEVMIAALPGQLTLTSETRLVAAPGPVADAAHDRASAALLAALAGREVLTLAQAGEILEVKDPMPAVKRLMERGALMLEEQLRDDHKPRMVGYVRLSTAASEEEALHDWFDQLEKKAPKQLHMLMRYVELSRCLSDAPREVEKRKLLHLSGGTAAMLRQLVEKGLFETYEREAGSAPEGPYERPAGRLSDAQAKALAEIEAAFERQDVVLLHGVTSSGKTEVYARPIDAQLAMGRQVLYLLPEIALTSQMIGRLRGLFGDRVAVYHSRMPQRERTALWMRMARGEGPSILVGARSALFLPFTKLGLVVVDEEHDPSYKQHEPAPRYQARDMAIVLAALHGARTILGSATPSMESLHNAHAGKYGHVKLLTRYGDLPMPSILRVDLREARRMKKMRGHFSATLIDTIQQAIGRREQVILFQNRRGYVPVWQCAACGWVPECDHCDVSLTYHKHDHQLRCHYCARRYTPPVVCGHCGGNRLRMLGFGTEKIEEELAGLFPEARIARLDQDTARGRNAVDRILEDLAQGALDILVGTQMVTKGLDFDRVSVVGILHADNLMRFPDFRAHERAFQLMAQVAGRSGRRDTPGTVVIQADEVGHPVLDLVARHDVEGMYQRELGHRLAHGYPPFTRIIKLTLKHRHQDRVAATARVLAEALREGLGERVLGPDIPGVSRVRDLHLRDLMIKIRRSAHHSEKAYVRETIDRVFALPEHAPVRLVTDVDPN